MFLPITADAIMVLTQIWYDIGDTKCALGVPVKRVTLLILGSCVFLFGPYIGVLSSQRKRRRDLLFHHSDGGKISFKPLELKCKTSSKQ